MLDIKFVRENPDAVDKSCESRQNAHWDRQKFFELDEERRSVIAEVEKLQADRNAVSKQIGLLMKDGKKDEEPKTTFSFGTVETKKDDKKEEPKAVFSFGTTDAKKDDEPKTAFSF